MYAILAEMGFITVDDLASYRVLGGICQGHVDMKWCPGVDFSAGSLGMGLSFGMGSAIAGRLEQSERQVYVMLGDGEIQEGASGKRPWLPLTMSWATSTLFSTETESKTTISAKSKCGCLTSRRSGGRLVGMSKKLTATTWTRSSTA